MVFSLYINVPLEQSLGKCSNIRKFLDTDCSQESECVDDRVKYNSDLVIIGFLSKNLLDD